MAKHSIYVLLGEDNHYRTSTTDNGGLKVQTTIKKWNAMTRQQNDEEYKKVVELNIPGIYVAIVNDTYVASRKPEQEGYFYLAGWSMQDWLDADEEGKRDMWSIANIRQYNSDSYNAALNAQKKAVEEQTVEEHDIEHDPLETLARAIGAMYMYLDVQQAIEMLGTMDAEWKERIEEQEKELQRAKKLEQEMRDKAMAEARQRMNGIPVDSETLAKVADGIYEAMAKAKVVDSKPQPSKKDNTRIIEEETPRGKERRRVPADNIYRMPKVKDETIFKSSYTIEYIASLMHQAMSDMGRNISGTNCLRICKEELAYLKNMKGKMIYMVDNDYRYVDAMYVLSKTVGILREVAHSDYRSFYSTMDVKQSHHLEVMLNDFAYYITDGMTPEQVRNEDQGDMVISRYREMVDEGILPLWNGDVSYEMAIRHHYAFRSIAGMVKKMYDR